MSFQAYKSLILDSARQSIIYALEHNHALKPDHATVPEPLLQQGACFVTLEIDHQLRGCIGHLEPVQALIDDICENAYAAAFADPRFPTLAQHELDNLDIHVSILTPANPIAFTNEEDLIKQIRPGIDGLILEDQGHRGTFLPSVWESLPEAPDFLRHLKRKAGLPENHWSEHIRVSRYETEIIK